MYVLEHIFQLKTLCGSCSNEFGSAIYKQRKRGKGTAVIIIMRDGATAEIAGQNE